MLKRIRALKEIVKFKIEMFESLIEGEWYPSEDERHLEARLSYNKIIDLTFWNVIRSESKKEEKVFLLNYLIDTILDDICTAYIAEPLLYNSNKLAATPFPTEYIDENGEKQVTDTGRKVTVSLANTRLHLHPHGWDRTLALVSKISGEDFEFQPRNHKSIYYPELNLCHVTSGNHSMNAGRYLKKGKIISHEHDLKPLFTRYYTNGSEWYDVQTRDEISQVADFRFAAVYTLARMRADIVEYGSVSKLTLRTCTVGGHRKPHEEYKPIPLSPPKATK